MNDEHSQPDQGADVYNVMADKVGFVPNLRPKDNLYQGVATLTCGLAGAVIAAVLAPQGGLTAAGLGGVGGLIVGILLSGAVLTVVGLFRKS